MKQIAFLCAFIGIALPGCAQCNSAPNPASEIDSKEPAAKAKAAPKGSLATAAPDAYPSQVAGGFYSDDATVLRAQIAEYLHRASTETIARDRDIVGIIAPHAGYPYSGPVAGEAYKTVQGRNYRTVVVLALCHRQRAAKAALLDRSAYRTPLGDHRIDQNLVRQILATRGDLFAVNEGVFRGEHSLEVQLPFIQVALPHARIVPVIVAVDSQAFAVRVGRALYDMLGSRRDILFVVSSDFSHFYPYREAKAYDLETLSFLQNWQLEKWRKIGRTQRGMCGYMPTLSFLSMFENYPLKKRDITLISYKNSGDTAGDKIRVVGYGALAFSLENGMRTENEPEEDFGPFSREHRRYLIDLAKKAVFAAANGEHFRPENPDSKLLSSLGAAFVTLKKDGQLRGCIGHVVARVPLFECVADMARSAAIQDLRFRPVQPDELNDLTYEISVLTAPETTTAEEVVVGRDGLIMSRGGRSGLLLPQVPVEWKWDRVQFLQHTCRKAGLPLDCWKHPDTEIKRFRAIVFGEDDL